MIESIKKIIREASELMLTDVFDIRQKGGFSNIVTSSDIAVQEYLREHLQQLLPGSGFICEEDEKHDRNSEYTWIIDPIDGTANYSRGIRECAIAVGLRHDGEMVSGVVFIPRTGEMFWAERGKGAFLGERPIHVSDRPFADSVICTAFSVYHKENTCICADIIQDVFMQCNDFRRFGAAAPELCYVAMGRCELYFEYILSPWDFAAASLILEEAGGCLCNLQGQPLDHTTATGVLAANSTDNLHKLVSIVQKHTNK